jgi:pilus assembly protein CpaF
VIPSEVFQQTLLHFLEPIRSLLDDARVTDIFINGPNEVLVERQGLLEPTDIRFPHRETLVASLRVALQSEGKRLDHAVGLRMLLPEGQRLDAWMDPGSKKGPFLAIRCPPKEPVRWSQLIEKGVVSHAAADALAAMMQGHINLLVTGVARCGKSCFTSALSECFSAQDRVIVLEQFPEVPLRHPQALTLRVSPETPALSVWQSARGLRADRLVLSEVWPELSSDLVRSLNAGQSSCIAMIEASSPLKALNFLESLVIANAPHALADDRLRIALGAAFSCIIHLERETNGARNVTTITEIVSYDRIKETYQVRDLFVREARGFGSDGQAMVELRPTGTLPNFLPQLRKHGADLPSTVYQAAKLSGSKEAMRLWTNFEYKSSRGLRNNQLACSKWEHPKVPFP